jgi:SAM-dependent methyltransferase
LHRGDPVVGWERLAQRDSQYYIDPTVGRDTDPDEFREGGRAVVDWAVAWGGEPDMRGRALEIGCGVGRDTIHLARYFEHVDGVDIAPTMILAAQGRGLPGNVRLHLVSGCDLAALPDSAFAFAFSHLVFQHIESDDQLGQYLRQIAGKLKPGGIAVLHFDTRPDHMVFKLIRRLPDTLLPRQRRRHIRRIRRSAEEVRGYAGRAGLVLDAEVDPATANHWLRLRKPGS